MKRPAHTIAADIDAALVEFEEWCFAAGIHEEPAALAEMIALAEAFYSIAERVKVPDWMIRKTLNDAKKEIENARR
jgi:hypothetical protein